MCDDELIPPQADMTEDAWLRSGALPDRAATRSALAAPALPWMNRRTLLAAAGGAALAALPYGMERPAAAQGAQDRFPLPEAPDANGEFAVLLTGDAGNGAESQYAVAAAARDLVRSENIQLAVGLGDNLYENGAESAEDTEFQDKFEKPNTGIDVPWLMVLGNHDCSGLIPGSGGDPSRGDREVAYAATSPRWHMPARYYSVALPAGAGATTGDPVVEFFALDTNPLSSYVVQTDPYYRWDGPYMRQQRAWLDGALQASRARWKVVLGHHPYLNNGQHGSAGSYDGFTVGHYTSGIHLKELYEEVVCHRADLILSGHDHTLQVLEPTPSGTRQVVCGAASKTGDGRAAGEHPAAWQDFTHLGFMILKVSRSGMTLNAYTVNEATRTAHLAHTTRTSTPVNVAAAGGR